MIDDDYVGEWRDFLETARFGLLSDDSEDMATLRAFIEQSETEYYDDGEVSTEETAQIARALLEASER